MVFLAAKKSDAYQSYDDNVRAIVELLEERLDNGLPSGWWHPPYVILCPLKMSLILF